MKPSAASDARLEAEIDVSQPSHARVSARSSLAIILALSAGLWLAIAVLARLVGLI